MKLLILICLLISLSTPAYSTIDKDSAKQGALIGMDCALTIYVDNLSNLLDKTLTNVEHQKVLDLMSDRIMRCISDKVTTLILKEELNETIIP